MGSADDRRFEVLRAIVDDFVATQEPIGSKTLVDRHNLGVSSATVRNDMAVLEAEGTSPSRTPARGRIPTEGLPRVRRPARRHQADVAAGTPGHSDLPGIGVDLDDVLRRAVRLLAQLTRRVAVVRYPTLSSSTVRHLGWWCSRRSGCC